MGPGNKNDWGDPDIFLDEIFKSISFTGKIYILTQTSLKFIFKHSTDKSRN